MLTIKSPPKYLDIVQHPNHFYEFIFKPSSASRLAFDEWLFYMEQLYQMPPSIPLKLLTNTHFIQTIPLAYAFRKAQPVIKRYPHRPKARGVFLAPVSQGVMDKMLQSFIQLLRTGDDIHYFYGDNREQSLDFLFAKEPENRPERLSNMS